MGYYKVQEESLTAVADAIRSKAGTKDGLVFPDGFVSAVEGIPKGVTEAEWKDVVFIDYDGTVLHSYTLAEMQALTELPPLPSHDGLICQEWNWTLADIKALNRAVTVGANYITDDGATRLFIRIPTAYRKTVPLYFKQTVANGVTIDWGDGSNTETLSGTGVVNTSHEYAQPGDYVISLLPLENCSVNLTAENSSVCVLGNYNNGGRAYAAMLQKVHLGKNISTSGDYSFYYCVNLKAISIPTTLRYYGVGMLNGCRSLQAVVVPRNVGYIGYEPFRNCVTLKQASFPNEIGTKINSNTFYFCYSMQTFTMPNSMTSVPGGFLAQCEALSYVKIPASVTSVGAEAFKNCYGLKVVDFTSCTSIPTLSNTNALDGLSSDCEIRVPSSLYSGWISATNWSNHSSKIVGV